MDYVFDYLNLSFIQPGDVVISSLPITLAARICEMGGRYLHLTLTAPPAGHRTELSVEDMHEFGAQLEEYVIYHIATDPTLEACN